MVIHPSISHHALFCSLTVDAMLDLSFVNKVSGKITVAYHVPPAAGILRCNTRMTKGKFPFTANLPLVIVFSKKSELPQEDDKPFAVAITRYPSLVVPLSDSLLVPTAIHHTSCCCCGYPRRSR